MSTKEEMIIAAQAALDAANALEVTATGDVTEVDVVEDGVSKKFVPEN